MPPGVDVFAAYNESLFDGLAGSDVIAIPYEYKIGQLTQ